MIVEKTIVDDEAIKADTIHMLDQLDKGQLETVQAIIKDIILHTEDYLINDIEDGTDVIKRRKSIFGRLKGRVNIADDFNDTPECFKGYICTIHGDGSSVSK